ncbi:uncharacterized protein N7529_002286 [Penicillium soppii]|uniref:uncharacterized protein n=1 Tax=Penicillium soppii TaxID=69789 RepID=UPI0025476E76|nr:uncharacterized protein N7529_002286 [Penicillium soppii]KAJ5873856.1 hypothetical protein N7529_002286 [Penicillium soppii]
MALKTTRFSQTLVDEEKCPGHDLEDHYLAKPGEILADRYQFLGKICWGTSSTVISILESFHKSEDSIPDLIKLSRDP